LDFAKKDFIIKLNEQEVAFSQRLNIDTTTALIWDIGYNEYRLYKKNDTLPNPNK